MFRDGPYVALNPCRSAAFFLRQDGRVAFFISLRMEWKKGDELSSHILLRCEIFRSRSVSRVFPRDIDFAGYLKMSNINIEAWFWDLVSFGYHALRC